jgi:hypothetical protein
MKNCLHCSNEFISKQPHAKYCTKKCRVKAFNKRLDEKIRNNVVLKEIKNKTERLRYRKKHNILSDLDLKKAPKGSGTITRYGYRQIRKHGHPNAGKNGIMFEHVYVMSTHLGRSLCKHENIHHKNGIRSDNRIENLELWSRSQPPGQRVEDKIKWCKEFLENYGFSVIQNSEN